MTRLARSERLQADRDMLAALAAASTIFSFDASGEPPDRYTLSFRGKGLAPNAAAQADVSITELHQVDLRMPFSYPDSPPDIRWLTPLWHPNVSFSGFVNLADAGLIWSGDVPIDIVCERLWDLARGAFTNSSRATNHAARIWFEQECQLALPVDPRPLRDRAAAIGGSNIVHYRRRSGQPIQFAGVAAAGEAIFIDENTPTPSLPQRRPYVPVGRRRGDDEVFYIGPE